MKQSYWFMGGKYSLAIMILISIIGIIATTGEGWFSGIGWTTPILPTEWLLRGTFVQNNDIILVVLTFVLWFVAGSILGWLYGKIKNRKKV